LNIYVFNFYIFHISFNKKKIHHSQDFFFLISFLCDSLHICMVNNDNFIITVMEGSYWSWNPGKVMDFYLVK
jgi:hypothetical protein